MANIKMNTSSAVADIKALIVEIKKLKKQVNLNKTNNASAFKSLEASTSSLKSKIALLNNKMKYAETLFSKQEATIKKLTAQVKRNTTANSKNTTSIKQQTKASGGLRLSLLSLVKVFGIIGGLSLFVDILRQTYEQIKTFDSLDFAIKKVTETSFEYAAANRFVQGLVEDFGVELITTTDRWIKFRAAAKNAGLTLNDSEKIFKSMTKAAGTLGLKTDETRSIYLALEQMLSKGKVSTEELRRQLGERLPGAMGIMAASLGVTIPELDKMLRKGEILSSEVLPGFADAVEVAFGIENVDKIETIVAAENRAISAWQRFVKNIAGSDTVINNVLARILDGFGKMTNAINFLMDDRDEESEGYITGFEKIEAKKLKERAKLIIESGAETKRTEEQIKKDIAQSKADLEKTANSEERKALKEHLKSLRIELVAHNKIIEAKTKEIAKSEFEDIRMRYENIKKERSDFYKIADAEEERLNKKSEENSFLFPKPLFGDNTFEKRGIRLAEKETGKILSNIQLEYETVSAAYNVYRKLIDESEVAFIPDDGGGSGAPRIEMLKTILDLEKQIQIEIGKRKIESNNNLIAGDTIGNTDRIRIEKENNKILNRIADLQYEIEVEKIEIKEKEKLAKLEELQNKGVTIVGDVEQQKIDIAKEADQKIIIAQEKRNKSIIKNEQDLKNKTLKIVEEVRDDRVEIVKTPFDIEIAKIKETYEASKKTNKDKKAMEESLKKVAIDSVNAQIDAQISLLRTQILVGEQSQETIDSLIRKIKELEAAKQVYVKSNDEELDNTFWDDLLELARQYNAAIGDIFDANYDRKIEQIEYEIDAETKKYDKLIALAEGDADQQVALENSKRIRLEELEKKKLKEEQKRAKARKAFAIADITISTAQAIMRTYGQEGFIGGTVFAGLLAALGALQIAAVVATPIPQYKDGGRSPRNELAMINDGGRQEYVERSGKLLTTTTENALVNLQAGDTVYKSYDDMINKSLLIPNGVNEVGGGSEALFNDLYFGIKSSIKDGLKQAKFNNNIKLVNRTDNYAETKSRWN